MHDAIDLYIEELPRKRPNAKQQTRHGYVDIIERSIRPYLGRLTLAELTTDLVDGWQAELGEAGRYDDAKKGHWLLSDICSRAKALGGVDENPVDDALPPVRRPAPVEAVDEEMRLLTVEEVTAFRQALHRWEHTPRRGPRPDPQIPRIFLGFIATGARPNEILDLRVQDVAPDGSRITIAGTLVVDEDRKTIIGQPTPKRSDSYRSIPLAAAAAAAFRDQLAHRGPGADPAELLFQTREGTPFALSNVMRTLKAVGVSAGIEGFFAYMARRGVGNAVYQATGEDRAAAFVLGHAGTEVWKKHYQKHQLRVVADDVAEVMDKLLPELDDAAA